jgi:hypothetical protein
MSAKSVFVGFDKEALFIKNKEGNTKRPSWLSGLFSPYALQKIFGQPYQLIANS